MKPSELLHLANEIDPSPEITEAAKAVEQSFYYPAAQQRTDTYLQKSFLVEALSAGIIERPLALLEIARAAFKLNRELGASRFDSIRFARPSRGIAAASLVLRNKE